MQEKTEEYRMYHLVPYNLSPIQQGIQAGHSALEFAEVYKDTDQYKHFIKHDKTFIVLNGGTSNNASHKGPKLVPGDYNRIEVDETSGSMENHWNYLVDLECYI